MPEPFLQKSFSLEGKVVVLTGGGGVLAGAMAEAMARCGASIAALDLRAEAAREVSERIVRDGGRAVAFQADVLERDSLESARSRVVAEFGRVDCLVNAAGGNRKEATTSDELSFFEIPLEANRGVMELNFTGTVLACQVFGSEIVKRSKGAILNVASVAGFRPLTRAPAYAAAKAAVINFTRWLSVHMARNYSAAIRVNALAPGFCATEQNRYLLFDENGELTERGRTILDAVPQNRFGEGAELASAAVWLLSDSASFVTGSVVTIDGGFDAFSGV